MSNLIKGKKHDWETVIGLEIHAQVKSNSKLFSSSSTAFGSKPNSQVSLVDAAMPGMLPVINKYCIEQAIKTGIGLNAKINKYSVFDRKNYFYADLPQGYQISQLYHPIVGEGEVIVNMEPGIARRVRIERIHMEQDAGKSIHDMDPDMSFVDLNRTGVCLMEIEQTRYSWPRRSCCVCGKTSANNALFGDMRRQYAKWKFACGCKCFCMPIGYF